MRYSMMTRAVFVPIPRPVCNCSCVAELTFTAKALPGINRLVANPMPAARHNVPRTRGTKRRGFFTKRRRFFTKRGRLFFLAGAVSATPGEASGRATVDSVNGFLDKATGTKRYRSEEQPSALQSILHRTSAVF